MNQLPTLTNQNFPPIQIIHTGSFTEDLIITIISTFATALLAVITTLLINKHVDKKNAELLAEYKVADDKKFIEQLEKYFDKNISIQNKFYYQKKRIEDFEVAIASFETIYSDLVVLRSLILFYEEKGKRGDYLELYSHQSYIRLYKVIDELFTFFNTYYLNTKVHTMFLELKEHAHSLFSQMGDFQEDKELTKVDEIKYESVNDIATAVLIDKISFVQELNKEFQRKAH
ncbi:hypothetical protein [Enterococcus sp. AZ109]|uniref:hypothetical protein n=1 Tax=Enterococcus sp. AZ109 TaxID=2774634 RepID=UPI003F21710F